MQAVCSLYISCKRTKGMYSWHDVVDHHSPKDVGVRILGGLHCCYTLINIHTKLKIWRSNMPSSYCVKCHWIPQGPSHSHLPHGWHQNFEPQIQCLATSFFMDFISPALKDLEFCWALMEEVQLGLNWPKWKFTQAHWQGLDGTTSTATATLWTNLHCTLLPLRMWHWTTKAHIVTSPVPLFQSNALSIISTPHWLDWCLFANGAIDC